MASKNFVGNKVKILSDGNYFEGIIASVSAESNRITLEKVVSLKDNQKLGGLTHFFSYDIDELHVIEEYVPDDDFVVDNRNKGGHNLVTRKMKPGHLARLKHVDTSELVMKANAGSEREDTSYSTDERMSDRDNAKRSRASSGSVVNKTTDKYTVIDEYGESFDAAISRINGEEIIGLAAEGILLGRDGTLCWIQMSVGSFVYLFDIISLGQGVFSRGLGDVISSEKIQKVVHDSRFLSDILHHQYDLDLVNVFDTQVACVLVYKIFHGNDLPAYVDSLSTAIFNHLPEIDVQDVFIVRVRQTSMKDDLAIWAERPACKAVIDGAYKNAAHLLRLRTVLMNKLLTDLVDGIDIYLGVVRDASSGPSEARKVMHELPKEFRNIRSCAEERRQRHLRRDMRDEMFNKNGFRLNAPAVNDPYVKLCVDGVSFKRNGIVERNRSPVRRSRRGHAFDQNSSARRRNNKPRDSAGDDDCLVPSASKTSKSPKSSDTAAKPKKVISFLAAGCEGRSAMCKKRERLHEAPAHAVSSASAPNDSTGAYHQIPDSAYALNNHSKQLGRQSKQLESQLKQLKSQSKHSSGVSSAVNDIHEHNLDIISVSNQKIGLSSEDEELIAIQAKMRLNELLQGSNARSSYESDSTDSDQLLKLGSNKTSQKSSERMRVVNNSVETSPMSSVASVTSDNQEHVRGVTSDNDAHFRGVTNVSAVTNGVTYGATNGLTNGVINGVTNGVTNGDIRVKRGAGRGTRLLSNLQL